MNHDEASPTEPLCDDPRGATAFDVTEAIRRVFEPHAEQIVAAFIFGSVASGTATARSDIDLMIIGALDYDTVYTVTDEAGLQLGCEVSPVLISLNDWRREASIPRSFAGSVRASPKLFVFGSEVDL